MDYRVFISIHLPDTEDLRCAIDDLKDIEGMRTSPPDQMHITLKFIGDVNENKIPKIKECVRKACEGVSPFRITLRGTGAFPNPRRPSVVWIGADPEDIMSGIARRIGDNLRCIGIGFDDKRFKSHITIGRCRDPVNIDEFLNRYSETEFMSFECSEVLVMRSVLGPRGAKHTVLERIELT